MKRWKLPGDEGQAAKNRIALQGGSYSIIITAVVLAILMAAGLVGATAVFAIVAQPFAAHRAENMGVSRETYLRRQRIWAVVGAIIAVAIVAFATWYNLDLRPTLDTWA